MTHTERSFALCRQQTSKLLRRSGLKQSKTNLRRELILKKPSPHWNQRSLLRKNPLSLKDLRQPCPLGHKLHRERILLMKLLQTEIRQFKGVDLHLLKNQDQHHKQEVRCYLLAHKLLKQVAPNRSQAQPGSAQALINPPVKCYSRKQGN